MTRPINICSVVLVIGALKEPGLWETKSARADNDPLCLTRSVESNMQSQSSHGLREGGSRWKLGWCVFDRVGVAGAVKIPRFAVELRGKRKSETETTGAGCDEGQVQGACLDPSRGGHLDGQPPKTQTRVQDTNPGTLIGPPRPVCKYSLCESPRGTLTVRHQRTLMACRGRLVAAKMTESTETARSL